MLGASRDMEPALDEHWDSDDAAHRYTLQDAEDADDEDDEDEDDELTSPDLSYPTNPPDASTTRPFDPQPPLFFSTDQPSGANLFPSAFPHSSPGSDYPAHSDFAEGYPHPADTTELSPTTTYYDSDPETHNHTSTLPGGEYVLGEDLNGFPYEETRSASSLPTSPTSSASQGRNSLSPIPKLNYFVHNGYRYDGDVYELRRPDERSTQSRPERILEHKPNFINNRQAFTRIYSEATFKARPSSLRFSKFNRLSIASSIFSTDNPTPTTEELDFLSAFLNAHRSAAPTSTDASKSTTSTTSTTTNTNNESNKPMPGPSKPSQPDSPNSAPLSTPEKVPAPQPQGPTSPSDRGDQCVDLAKMKRMELGKKAMTSYAAKARSSAGRRAIAPNGLALVGPVSHHQQTSAKGSGAQGSKAGKGAGAQDGRVLEVQQVEKMTTTRVGAVSGAGVVSDERKTKLWSAVSSSQGTRVLKTGDPWLDAKLSLRPDDDRDAERDDLADGGAGRLKFRQRKVGGESGNERRLAVAIGDENDPPDADRGRGRRRRKRRDDGGGSGRVRAAGGKGERTRNGDETILGGIATSIGAFARGTRKKAARKMIRTEPQDKPPAPKRTWRTLMFGKWM